MAASSLRLHVNGVSYRVDRIPKGVSYKDVLCTIAKTANQCPVPNESSNDNALTDKRQCTTDSERSTKKITERRSRRREKGKESRNSPCIGQKVTDRKRKMAKNKTTHSKHSLRSTKSLSASRLSMDDSDLEKMRKYHRMIRGHTERRTREESDALICQNLLNFIGTQQSQLGTEHKKHAKNMQLIMMMKNDVEKISVYYIDSKTDGKLGGLDTDLRCAFEDRESKSDVGGWNMPNVMHSQQEREKDHGVMDDKDSGVPSWESEETSSKDGQKQNISYKKVPEHGNHSKKIINGIKPSKSCPVLSTVENLLCLNEYRKTTSEDLTMDKKYKEDIEKEISHDKLSGIYIRDSSSVKEAVSNVIPNNKHGSTSLEQFSINYQKHGTSHNKEINDDFDQIEIDERIIKCENENGIIADESTKNEIHKEKSEQKSERTQLKNVEPNSTNAENDVQLDRQENNQSNVISEQKDDENNSIDAFQLSNKLRTCECEIHDENIGSKKIKEDHRGSFIIFDFDDIDVNVATEFNKDSNSLLDSKKKFDSLIDESCSRKEDEENEKLIMDKNILNEQTETKEPLLRMERTDLKSINSRHFENVKEASRRNITLLQHKPALREENNTTQYLIDKTGTQTAIKQCECREKHIDDLCSPENRKVNPNLEKKKLSNVDMEEKHALEKVTEMSDTSRKTMLIENKTYNEISVEKAVDDFLSENCIKISLINKNISPTGPSPVTRKKSNITEDMILSNSCNAKLENICLQNSVTENRDQLAKQLNILSSCKHEDTVKEAPNRLFSWFKKKGKKETQRKETNNCKIASQVKIDECLNGFKEIESIQDNRMHQKDIKDVNNNNGSSTLALSKDACNDSVETTRDKQKSTIDRKKTKKVTFMVDEEAEERKDVMKKYWLLCNKVYKVLEKLLYNDLLIEHYTFELDELMVIERSYDDVVLEKDEKAVIIEIMHFKEYLKSVTMFTKHQRQKIMENDSKITNINQLIHRKNVIAMSLEKCLKIKRFGNTPRVLSRKLSNRKVTDISVLNIKKHFSTNSNSVKV